MVTEDPIRQALRLLEWPVEPPAEFADALFARLLDEVRRGEVAVPAARPPVRRVRRPRLRSPRLVAVAAAAVAVAVVAAAVLFFPRPESALAIVQEAQARFAEIGSLHAVLERVVSSEQLRSELDREVPDWVQVTEISYRDDEHFRRGIVSDTNNPFAPQGQAGSFHVVDPEFRASHDAASNTFTVFPTTEMRAAERRSLVLLELSPQFYEGPRLTEEAIRTRCDVLPDDEVAGRPARHISCEVEPIPEEGLFPGDRAHVWLDSETGVVLRITFPNGGRLEVKSIEYGVSLPEDTFRAAPPAGASIVWEGAGPPPPQYRVEVTPGKVSATIKVGGRPDDVAVSEGAVWVGVTTRTPKTPYGPGVVKRIDPTTNQVVAEISLPGKFPSLLATDGLVFVRWSRGRTDRIQRIDPETNSLAGPALKVPEGGGGMVVSDGSLWVVTWDPELRTIGGTVHGGLGEVLRVDLATNKVVARIRFDASLGPIAAGEGSVWVTGNDVVEPEDPNAPGPAALYRIDPRTNRIVATLERPGIAGFGGMAVGEGALWATLEDFDAGTGFLLRVNPRRDRIEDRIRVGKEPAGVALGGGLVWVGSWAGNSVVKVDPRTNQKVGKPIRVGSGPSRLAVDEVAVWVANFNEKTVARIDL